jgi:hypothetical protein
MNLLQFRKTYYSIFGKYKDNPYTPVMEDKKILFIHIPKSGGTSIATALLEKPSGHPYLYEYYYANKSYTKNFFKFCVVRNPFDRLVSAYAHISQRDCQQRFKDLFNELNIATFYDLIKCLDNPKKYKKIVNTIVHFRSQHELIEHKNIKMDVIYKFEEFDNIEKDINKRLKTNISISKLNSSPRKSYREYYDAYAKDVVSRIYRKDLDLFDYKF